MNFIQKNWKGILVCLVMAVPCWLLGQRFPIVGGPVFGILAGMIVMELIYGALQYFAIAIPAALSLYFNFFDSAIQAYIFITLTLSYVSEAIE